MAEGGQISSVLQHLGGEIECSVCLARIPEDPRLLSCGHSFCFRCLEQTYASDVAKNICPSDQIRCPKCRFQSQLLDKEVKALPVDHRTKTLIALLHKLQFSSPGKVEDVELYCGICQKEGLKHGAVFYCVTCENLLCDDCSIRHDGKTNFASHVTASVTPDTLSEIRCSNHNRFISHFCTDCLVSVCSLCVAEVHNAHTISEFIHHDHKTQSSNSDNSRLCHYLNEAIQDLQFKKIQLTKANEENSEQHPQIIQQIKQHTDKMIDHLRHQESELCLKADRHHKNVETIITELTSNVDVAMSSVSDLLHSIERFKYPLSHNKQISHNGKNLISKWQDTFTRIPLQSTDQITVDYTYIPSEVVGVGQVECHPHPATHILEEDSRSTNFSQNAELLWNDSSISYASQVKHVSHMKSLLYCVKDTRFKKCYKLCMKDFNGEDVSLPSGLPIVESSQIILLGINKEGKGMVLVSEGTDNKDIITVVECSEQWRNISTFSSLDDVTMGTAFTHDDNVIIIKDAFHEGSLPLCLYSPTGDIIWATESFGSCHGDEPCGPADMVVDLLGRILVADHHNNKVHVHNADGFHIKSFPDKCEVDPFRPWCLSCDSMNNIFVGLAQEPAKICKYTPNGTFIRDILYLESFPVSMCIIDDTHMAVGTQKHGLLFYKLI